MPPPTLQKSSNNFFASVYETVSHYAYTGLGAYIGLLTGIWWALLTWPYNALNGELATEEQG